jgi:DNA-binding NtrC family response regulator
MLEKVCNRLNRPRLRLSSDALTVIQSYRWPGNVRELENAVERAVILGEGEEVTVEQLAIPGTVIELMSTGAASTTTANLSLDEYFLHYVLRNQEHMTETEIAKGLGISRKSLWERRQRLGIPRAGKR